MKIHKHKPHHFNLVGKWFVSTGRKWRLLVKWFWSDEDKVMRHKSDGGSAAEVTQLSGSDHEDLLPPPPPQLQQQCVWSGVGSGEKCQADPTVLHVERVPSFLQEVGFMISLRSFVSWWQVDHQSGHWGSGGSAPMSLLLHPERISGLKFLCWSTLYP